MLDYDAPGAQEIGSVASPVCNAKTRHAWSPFICLGHDTWSRSGGKSSAQLIVGMARKCAESIRTLRPRIGEK